VTAAANPETADGRWRQFAAGLPALLLAVAGVETYRGFGALPVTGAVIVQVLGLAGGALACAGVLRSSRRVTAAGLLIFAAACLTGALLPALGGWHGGPVWPVGGVWLLVFAVHGAASGARTVADGAVIGAAAAFAFGSLLPAAVDEPGLSAYLVPVGAALAVAVYLGNRSRRENDRLRAVAARVRESERTAMAHELHDRVAHEVAGIAVLTQAGLAVGRSDIDLLDRIGASAARALADIRSMVEVLRDSTAGGPALTPSGTDAASLADLVDTFADSSPAPVRVAIDDDLGADVPGVVYLAAHRILSESLTNVRRHAASAAEVSVGVRRDGAVLVVEVSNPLADGPEQSVGAGPGSGSGVRGMAERAAAVGGTAEIGADGDRWRVRAMLPVPEGTRR